MKGFIGEGALIHFMQESGAQLCDYSGPKTPSAASVTCKKCRWMWTVQILERLLRAADFIVAEMD